MTLLTVCQSLAKDVGLSVPLQIVGSADREWIEALEFANDAGRELARRVDWTSLRKSTVLTGTGASIAFNLPAEFDRLQRGGAVMSGTTAARALTRAEWPAATSAGTPRYFLLEDDTLTLWPHLADLASVTVGYFSKNWVSGSDGYTADDQTADIDEELLAMGLVVRWRRQKGMPFQDYEAEYEAAIADRAAMDGEARF
jgi:hypothetical protein